MSSIEEQVCFKILKRSEVGKKKYGTTMERNDLTKLEWLKHAQEEAMDMAVYQTLRNCPTWFWNGPT